MLASTMNSPKELPAATREPHSSGGCVRMNSTAAFRSPMMVACSGRGRRARAWAIKAMASADSAKDAASSVTAHCVPSAATAPAPVNRPGEGEGVRLAICSREFAQLNLAGGTVLGTMPWNVT